MPYLYTQHKYDNGFRYRIYRNEIKMRLRFIYRIYSNNTNKIMFADTVSTNTTQTRLFSHIRHYVDYIYINTTNKVMFSDKVSTHTTQIRLCFRYLIYTQDTNKIIFTH